MCCLRKEGYKSTMDKIMRSLHILFLLYKPKLPTLVVWIKFLSLPAPLFNYSSMGLISFEKEEQIL